MELIKQSFTILQQPDNLTQMIELAGRTCYKSEDRITKDSSGKFASMLVNSGHHAMIEFGDIIVRFITNRGVTHELVRHRLCSFAQESTRYVNYGSTDIQFILPVWCETTLPTGKYDDVMTEKIDATELPEGDMILSFLRAERSYKRLLGKGWTPQKAREVLPNALKTEIVVKANVREWRHIFTLRCSKAAHPQMSALMIPLRDTLIESYPEVFSDLTED